MTRRYQWNGPHTRAQEQGITAADVPTGPRWGDECGGCDDTGCIDCGFAKWIRKGWGA